MLSTDSVLLSGVGQSSDGVSTVHWLGHQSDAASASLSSACYHGLRRQQQQHQLSVSSPSLPGDVNVDTKPTGKKQVHPEVIWEERVATHVDPSPSNTVYTHRSTDPAHHPKRHPDPISRFATIHFQTDRRTARRQVSKKSAYALLY